MNIESIMLRRTGGETGPNQVVVVEVKTAESGWREVIREPIDANFSHCVNLDSLLANKACDVDMSM